MKPIIETFTSPTSWRTHLKEQEAGSVDVANGYAVLSATSHLHDLPEDLDLGWPGFKDRDYLIVYLRQLLSYTNGYRAFTRTRRIAHGGQMTEWEFAWFGHAVLKHFEWTYDEDEDTTRLWYYSPHDLVRGNKRRVVDTFGNPELWLGVEVEPATRMIRAKAVNEDTGEVLFDFWHPWPDAHDPVYATMLDDCAMDFVVTTTNKTTPNNPIALAINDLVVAPLASDMTWWERVKFAFELWWKGVPNRF